MGDFIKIQNNVKESVFTKMLSFRNSSQIIQRRLFCSISISSPDLLELATGESSLESQSNSEIIYGIHPVNAALLAKRRTIQTVYYRRDLVENNEKIKAILEDCWAQNVPTKPVARSKISTFIPKDKPHQGLFAKVSRLYCTPFSCTAENIQSLVKETPSVWLMLNEVQDPMNFGAILRTAYFLGCGGIFVSHRNSCRLTPVVSKASSGAMELLPVHSVSNLPHFARVLRGLDWDVIGTTSSEENPESLPISSFQLKKSCLILLGNEGQGLSKELLDLCTLALYVESRRTLNTSIDSLNVSAASAIILHHLLNKCN